MAKPVIKRKVGNVEVAVWGNERKEGEGVIYSFTPQKSYKDGEEWKTTTSFNVNDVPKLQAALNLAYVATLTKDFDEETTE